MRLQTDFLSCLTEMTCFLIQDCENSPTQEIVDLKINPQIFSYRYTCNSSSPTSSSSWTTGKIIWSTTIIPILIQTPPLKKLVAQFYFSQFVNLFTRTHTHSFISRTAF